MLFSPQPDQMSFQWATHLKDSAEVEMGEADEHVENEGRDVECDHLDQELEVVFNPLEHPVEPLDEDQPLECPIPNTCILNAKDGMMEDEENVETPRKKRVEIAGTMERRVIALEAPPAGYKRHQTLPLKDDGQLSESRKEETK